jgi:hypothetical protein
MPSREPLITASLIVAAISAVIVSLRAFGVPITAEQEDALVKLAAIIAPLVLGFVARQFVWSPASAADVVMGTIAGTREGIVVRTPEQAVEIAKADRAAA